jgi:flavin reductase (DIM6/NTAB) family NADH-FMN oxidoreductase RutF
MSRLQFSPESPVTTGSPPSRETLEKVFRSFPYTLFVVIAGDRTQASGIVATWATQVSFHPPMVALAIERESKIRRWMESAGTFSLNFLPAGGRDIAAPFLKTPVSDGMTVGGQPLVYSPSGIPRLESSVASLCCRSAGAYDAGDHVLYLAEVVEAVITREGDVLALKETGWRYYR